jgi:radical SAM superfamily enzyme YgiQ (UPF0313 family)
METAAIHSIAAQKASEGKKPRITLVFKYMYPGELAQGIGILHSMLSENGYKVEQRNLNEDLGARLNMLMSLRPLERTIDHFVLKFNKGRRNAVLIRLLDALIDELDVRDSDLVGFSVHSKYHLPLYFALAKRIKERHGAKTVFGGPYIKLFHELIDMKQHGFIDYLAIADAELTVLGLARYLEGKESSLHDVPSLKFVENGKVVTSSVKVMESNLIPPPTFQKRRVKEMEALSHVGIGMPYEISKGCPHKCTFCTYPSLNRYRRKTIEKVIYDLKAMTEKNSSAKVKFTDATFNADPKFVNALCDAMIAEKLNLTWATWATPCISPELLGKMRQAGCIALYYGVETGSKRLNALMRKSVSVEDGERCLRDTAKAGIKVHANFIIGFPHERREDVVETLEFIRRNKEHFFKVYIYRFQLVKNTPIFLDPSFFRINILDSYGDFDFDTFKFDEVGGLGWDKKIMQTEAYVREVLSALRREGVTCFYDQRTHMPY